MQPETPVNTIVQVLFSSPVDPGVGSDFFFERSHVAYQIKGNGGKANILSLPSTPGMCSKGQIFFCEINFVCFVCLI